MPSQPLEYKIFYRQHLPHIQPAGATFFVTFRLAESIPTTAIERLYEEALMTERRILQIKSKPEQQQEMVLAKKRQFARWDAVLDAAACGPNWLSQPVVARVVSEAIYYHDNRTIDLDCFCIMSNHVHVVLTPLEEAAGGFFSLSRILHSIKSDSANRANRIIGREGRFWQHESYDHYVRDPEELRRIRRYVLDNPVKAGLADTCDRWAWSYCKYGFS